MCEHKYEFVDYSCPYSDRKKYLQISWEGKRYCIFHAPIESKRDIESKFWNSLFGLIAEFITNKANEWNFEGFIFPNAQNELIGYTFPNNVEIIFRSAVFTDNVNFSGAHFYYNVNFWRTKFLKVADFREAEFWGEVSFQWAQFSEGVYFSDAKFFNNTKFSAVRFLDEAWFSGITFRVPDNAIKEIKLEFNKVIFEREANFSSIHSYNDISFYRTAFMAQVYFDDALISNLDFFETTFRVRPYFNNIATNTEEVKITNLIADANIYITRAYKSAKTPIESLSLDKEKFCLKIFNCQLNGVINISAPLSMLEIGNSILNSSLIVKGDSNKYTQLKMLDNQFMGSASLSFVDIREFKRCSILSSYQISESSMKKSIIDKVDLSRIDFENVEWAEIARNKSKKVYEGLYEEKKFRSKRIKKKASYVLNLRKDINKEKDLKRKKKIEALVKHLEEMYRQIASSYESRRRYGMAGHFKAGEFEMRQVYAGGLDRLLLFLYRWSSFYGEEMLKPLVLLASVPLISTLFFVWVVGDWHFSWDVVKSFFGNSFIFWFAGLPNLISDAVSYTDGFAVWFAELPKNLPNSLTYGLQGLIPTFSYLSKNLGPGPGLASTFIGLMEKVFAAIFTSLFLFALRRRVKR